MSKNTFATTTAIPPLSAFGEWRTAGEDIWNEATVAPWRGLFENLDDLATDLPESETPLSLADEALAIFAACWRYGSYAHVLTLGAPLPEAIRRDPEAGRITDWEMRRIQIEFTAALAAWWELEDTNPDGAERRTQAAWEFLTMPRINTVTEDDVLYHLDSKMTELHFELEPDPDAGALLTKEWPVRLQANAAVVEAYRNGPIESLHAGRSMDGVADWPHVRRLYAPELQRITAWSVHRLMTWIAARRSYRSEGYSFMVARGLRQCSTWSADQESA
jgi:hypothetical protein